MVLSVTSFEGREITVQEENTGFSIGPKYATFYKRGGGTVRLRNITLEQVKGAAWFLVPLGLILISYGFEVFFSSDLSKEYTGLFAGYMVAMALCIFTGKIDRVVVFGALGYVIHFLGESGMPALVSGDMLILIVLVGASLTFVGLHGFFDGIWSPLVALMFVLVVTIPATVVYQDPHLVTRVTGFDDEFIGIGTFVLGLGILLQAFVIFIMHRAVEEQKDLVMDDSYPHPDSYQAPP
jgi:hypothetical protein